jgi:hypothetical protein
MPVFAARDTADFSSRQWEVGRPERAVSDASGQLNADPAGKMQNGKRSKAAEQQRCRCLGHSQCPGRNPATGQQNGFGLSSWREIQRRPCALRKRMWPIA